MITGLPGVMGRGKTLTMTIMAHIVANKGDDINIISNYETKYTTHYVKSPKDLYDLTDPEMQGVQGYVFLDEIWAWMDSRESGQNDLMSQLVLNSRKRRLKVFYSTQKLHQADKRLRENTNYLIVPLHYEKIETEADNDVLEVYIFDKYSMELVNSFKMNCEPFYGSYDTREEVSTVDKREQWDDDIKELVERVKQGEFQFKNELESHLAMKDVYSNSDAERLTNEVFRIYRNKHEDDDTNEGQSGLNEVI